MKLDTSNTPRPKRRISIRKPTDAIRLLNRVINALENETIEVDRARALIYAASTIGKLFEVADMEGRITRLEEKILGKS